MIPISDLLERELKAGGSDAVKMNRALRLLAKYRAAALQAELVRRHGTDVIGGPFAGMHFIGQSAEGCHIPKLLGCYEQELHPFVHGVAKRDYAHILNIGCAEGYYAVGFKRLNPHADVVACDTDSKAQRACAALAQRNGVALDIRGEFSPEHFAAFTGKTLVWCDIEGAEEELLNPVAAPALAHMDIVVELHPSPERPNVGKLPQRFSATHDISILWPQIGRTDLPDMFRGLSHLDQLLAIWEWRSTPTPWAIMLAKAPPVR